MYILLGIVLLSYLSLPYLYKKRKITPQERIVVALSSAFVIYTTWYFVLGTLFTNITDLSYSSTQPTLVFTLLPLIILVSPFVHFQVEAFKAKHTTVPGFTYGFILIFMLALYLSSFSTNPDEMDVFSILAAIPIFYFLLSAISAGSISSLYVWHKWPKKRPQAIKMQAYYLLLWLIFYAQIF